MSALKSSKIGMADLPSTGAKRFEPCTPAHSPQLVPTPQIQPGGSTTSSTTQCRVLGWTCSLTQPRCELLVTAPAAGLEPVQAGDKKVQQPIANPVSHESPKSLIVCKADAMPGTTGTANPPCLPWFHASISSDKVPSQGAAVRGYQILKGTSRVK